MNEKIHLTIKKTFAIAVQNHKKNNLKIAENLYKKILKINPNHASAHNNLGIIFLAFKEFQKAVRCYQRAIEIQSDYANAHNNLGMVLRELGEDKKAIDCYEKAIQINPNYVGAHSNLGNVLKELGEHEKAVSCYKKAIEIQPNHATTHYNLGLLFKSLGELKKTISCYKKAIQIQPNYADAHYNLGIVFKEYGEFEKAISCFQNVTKYKSENLISFYHLSELKERILDTNLKNKIARIMNSNKCTKENLAYGNFLLSKYELKKRNYKKEFNYLLKGHLCYFDSKKEKFKGEVEYWLNILPKIKELVNFNKSNKSINKTNHILKPIFIIGVPRCGSTLVEKIIASGTQYIPIGEETGILSAFVKQKIIQKQPLDSEIENLQAQLFARFKQKELIQEKNDHTFTDKTLDNFFYVSLIKQIFPHAKVINCRRSPLSSIMSILKSNLPTISWAHNLEHIFKYFDIYYKMIENFKITLPNFIYELQYEKLVNEPEQESKKLMQFCNLPWNAKCLEFYKRKDLISKTASNIQIRKAIYKDSINKHLPYKQFLHKYGNKYPWFV